jgi:hypothetical protein
MTDSPEPTVIDVDQLHGEAWAELRRDELVECSWLDRFSSMIPDGGAVVDVGCGCGSGLPIGRELVR